MYLTPVSTSVNSPKSKVTDYTERTAHPICPPSWSHDRRSAACARSPANKTFAFLSLHIHEVWRPGPSRRCPGINAFWETLRPNRLIRCSDCFFLGGRGCFGSWFLLRTLFSPPPSLLLSTRGRLGRVLEATIFIFLFFLSLLS